eukprot:TRINITY_DN4015_c0_g2_i1.p1 TRINITY_DN4015_c0_g2~~TRINITY_DN4015_c0_g2_i1.p1  ORF type:complete len:668 (+),score=177.23 TRINITY_DN4015_c0_g2_i1:176-2179(+)
MIYVDENEPIGELKPEFDHRNVLIKRHRDVRTEYEMLHEIGRGKFGRVMKCKDLECVDKYYAAKFVHTTRRDDRRNVEREVEIMNSLDHPKLLKLFDAYDNGRNEMCILTEYIGGGELFDRVIEDEFVLSEKACIAFMKQILQGVEFIHSQQIVHLDLKPENILCHTKTGNRIKIIDFGLARRYEPMKKLQVLFGTPEFVAPEVVNFEPIGYATDMWAVGVICYVLLSGLSPFMGDTDLETMANVTIAEYDYEDEVFENVSEPAKDFIDKLLMKEKGKRYSCKSCLSHPWLHNDNNNKELLLNAKENISSFQKDPSKKSNYYIFDHSNHTITPSTEESLLLSPGDLNRKRSLLENEENIIKRCKTPTREEQPKKTEQNWQPMMTPSEVISLSAGGGGKTHQSKEEDAMTEEEEEEDDMASEEEDQGEESLEAEENKENSLPAVPTSTTTPLIQPVIHSEALVNANEIEDPKHEQQLLLLSPSEPKTSHNVPSSPTSQFSQFSSMSTTSSSSTSSSTRETDPSTFSSSCCSPSSDSLRGSGIPRPYVRTTVETLENTFSEPKRLLVVQDDPPSPCALRTEEFDNSIAELSHKLNGSYLIGGKHNVDGYNSHIHHHQQQHPQQHSRSTQSVRKYFELDILSKESLRKSSFPRCCRDKIPVYLDIKSSQR